MVVRVIEDGAPLIDFERGTLHADAETRIAALTPPHATVGVVGDQAACQQLLSALTGVECRRATGAGVIFRILDAEQVNRRCDSQTPQPGMQLCVLDASHDDLCSLLAVLRLSDAVVYTVDGVADAAAFSRAMKHVAKKGGSRLGHLHVVADERHLQACKVATGQALDKFSSVTMHKIPTRSDPAQPLSDRISTLLLIRQLVEDGCKLREGIIASNFAARASIILPCVCTEVRYQIAASRWRKHRWLTVVSLLTLVAAVLCASSPTEVWRTALEPPVAPTPPAILVYTVFRGKADFMLSTSPDEVHKVVSQGWSEVCGTVDGAPAPCTSRAGTKWVGSGAFMLGHSGIPLYRCRTSRQTHFFSTDVKCEGQVAEGLLGHVSTERTPHFSRSLRRCYTGRLHFISLDMPCQWGHEEAMYGFVR